MLAIHTHYCSASHTRPVLSVGTIETLRVARYLHILPMFHKLLRFDKGKREETELEVDDDDGGGGDGDTIAFCISLELRGLKMG